MEKCSSYQQLSHLCREHWISVNEWFPLEAAHATVDAIHRWERDDAAALYPADAPPNLIPLKVVGDGNCCPHSLSIHAYGSEGTFSGNALQSCFGIGPQQTVLPGCTLMGNEPGFITDDCISK